VKAKNTRHCGLARALSKLGYCSRSQAARLIREGRVRLNGRVCRDPEHPAHSERDKIVVDSIPLKASTKIYLMMNKPRGVVTTTSDERGRDTVYDVLRKASPVQEKHGDMSDSRWVAPVGRLDKAAKDFCCSPTIPRGERA
jgi:23S rRNA pseudouridine2605 synthase